MPSATVSSRSVALRLRIDRTSALEFRPLVEAGDERAVDLEDVDRELAQVAQRRVAGAEVVDRQTDPEGLERPERRDGRLDVADEGRLGDLEREAGRVEPGRREDPRDVADEIGVGDLSTGQVDADRQVRPPASDPASRVV